MNEWMSEWVSEWVSELESEWVSVLRQSNSSCRMQTFIWLKSRFFLFFAFHFSLFAFRFSLFDNRSASRFYCLVSEYMSEWVCAWESWWVKKWVSVLRQSNSSCHMQTFISSKRKTKSEKRSKQKECRLWRNECLHVAWADNWRKQLTHTLSNSLTHSDTHSFIHVLRHLTVTTWNRPMIEKRKAKSEKQTNFWKTKSEKRKAY